MSDEIIPSKAQLPNSGAPARIDINGGQNTVYGQIGTVQDNRSNVLIAGGLASARYADADELGI